MDEPRAPPPDEGSRRSFPESLRLTPPAGGDSREGTPHNEYSRFIYLNRVPAQEILQAARRPFPFVFGLLIVVVWATARALAGPGAGVLAAGLIALDPGFVAHASIVHTDVGAALTMTAALVLALAAARRSSPALWAVSGLALGVALATKFSAVLLLPLFAAVPLLALLSEGEQRTVRSAATKALGVVTAGAMALGLLAATYVVSIEGDARGKAVRVRRAVSRRPRGIAARDRPVREAFARPSFPRALGRRLEGGRAPQRGRARERQLLPRRDLPVRVPGLLPRLLRPEVDAGVSPPPRRGARARAPRARDLLGRQPPSGGVLLLCDRDNVVLQHRRPPPLPGLPASRHLRGRRPGATAPGPPLRAGGGRSRPLDGGLARIGPPARARLFQFHPRQPRAGGGVVRRLERRLGPGHEAPAATTSATPARRRRRPSSPTAAWPRTTTRGPAGSSTRPGPSRPASTPISDSMQAVGTRSSSRASRAKPRRTSSDALLSQLRTRGRRLRRVGASITIWELPG